MKHLHELAGAHSSHVQLVDIDGVKWVLKTANPVEIVNEHLFFEVAKAHGMPVLTVLDAPDLAANQILLSYIDGSPTVGDNLSQETCRAWGAAAGALHRISHTTAAVLTLHGLESVQWKHFVQGQVAEATLRAKEKRSDLPVEQIQQALRELEEYVPTRYGLLHGDMHSNNALVDHDRVILFDKASDIFYGDPLFDLALVMIELFGEPELLRAFCEGYGSDFVREGGKVLNHYILLRAYSRHPNPFEPQIPQVVAQILETM